MVGACGGIAPEIVSDPLEDLDTARFDWRGDRSGLVWLRHRTTLRLTLPTDASQARARLELSGVLARLGPGAPGGESLAFVGLGDGSVPRCTTRTRGPSEGSEASGAGVIPVDPTISARIDPAQTVYRLPLPRLDVGAMIEVQCIVDSERPVSSGAVWLAAAGIPVAESIVELRIPAHAQAAMHVVGGSWRPLTIPHGEGHILAVRATSLAPRQSRQAHVRWALRGASPRGYDQRWTQNWGDATAEEHRHLVEGAAVARAKIILPMRPKGLSGRPAVRAVFRWVRDRLQVDADARDGVAPARDLGPPLSANTLTATDKVHLLKWMLDELEIPARFALGRSVTHPAAEVDFPTRGALRTPLLRVSLDGEEAWLDPSCEACLPGEVRPALRGGQAIVLPAGAAGPMPLTSSPWPPLDASGTSASP
jgi:hypothetical protein